MRAGDLDGSGSRGQESASIDSGLVAVAIALAQRLPGLQLLRPHLLPTVIQVVHVAAERALRVWPEEFHYQDLPPGERGERVGPTHETDAGNPAGKRHSRRIRRCRGRPKRAGCLAGMRETATMCTRVAVPATAGVRGVNPLGTSARTRFRPGRALRGRRQRAPYVGMPGKLGRGRTQPGRMPGADGDCRRRVRSRPHGGGVRPGRSTAPGAAGIRLPGDADEERSRAQVPGSGMLLRKAAPGRPRVIRAAGVSLPLSRARRRHECSDQRRSAAAAYAPGRRTTGTGVLGRTLDVRTHMRAASRSSRASVLSAGRVTVGHCTPCL